MDARLTLGIVGLGGFASEITDYVLSAMRVKSSPVELRAVCEPDEAKIASKREALDAAGVRIFREYEQLLEQPIEAVWLPLPIDLHLSYTQKALDAGKAVLCEKPAAGSIQDVDAMIAARDRSGLAVAVGYHDLFDPANWRMKDRLLAGDIGRIRSATLVGCWPRENAYFIRSWAGRLKRNGVWLLDSPANNAFAHYIHLALFFLGTSRATSAIPERVEAELYRANAIENYDTCSLRIRAGGVDLLVNLTHVCDQAVDPCIELVGEKGSARYQFRRPLELRRGDDVETWPLGDCRLAMLENFSKLVRGEAQEQVATLEMSRAHALAISGASEAAAVHSIPEEYLERRTLTEGAWHWQLKDLPTVFKQCTSRRQMLHESGLAAWSKPPGRMDLESYRFFRAPR